MTRPLVSLFFAACVLTAAPLALAGDGAPALYLDPSQPLEARVDDLVGRMTLEEKVSQMHDNAEPVARLGIPAYPWWSEALHGIGFAGPATVFPQAIGLAATFDPGRMLKLARAIGDEGRAKFHEAERRGEVRRFHGLTMFSPNINIFRDPRWGRGQETYGEDPYLAGRMGVAFVRGLQGDDPTYLKLGTTAKHYAVHSGPEPERHRFNAKGSLRDMRDTYLPAFEALVREGRTVSVMCAYNRVNGDPACANETLLDEFLRKKWGFDGYVVSDCGAIHDIHANHKVQPDAAHAAAAAVRAGCDVECDDQPAYNTLVDAVGRGLVDEAAIDQAVKRLYRVRLRLGLLDPPGQVPYAQIPFSVVGSMEHGQVALEAARASIVLLKNQGGTLPLPKSLRRIAVVGPNATDLEALRGNYAGDMQSPVTILDGIREKVGAKRVMYAMGVSHVGPGVEVIPASALKLTAEYFGNTRLEGQPLVTRGEALVDFDSSRGRRPEGVPQEQWSARWTGTLTVAKGGHHEIGFTGDDGYRVFLDDSLVVEDWKDHGPGTSTAGVELEAGRAYALKVEYYQNRGGATARLVWARPGLAETNLAEALSAARKADVVIAVMGLSPMLEGEEMGTKGEGFLGGDRTEIGLPKIQVDFLQKLAGTGKPVVLVLLNGSPLAVNWASEHLPAIVEAWYPGQEGGNAVADVLFGDFNPAGRLPLTFYKSVDDLPAFTDYSMEGRTYRYYPGQPLFPFGHGLSYTRFNYGPATLTRSQITTADDAEISVEVTNAGALAGEEVVQLYVTALDPGGVRAPIRALAGFERVHLAAGTKTVVRFTLRPDQRRLWDHAGDPVPMTGRVRLSVGGKQPGFKGLADASTTGVSEAELTVAGQ